MSHAVETLLAVVIDVSMAMIASDFRGETSDRGRYISIICA